MNNSQIALEKAKQLVVGDQWPSLLGASTEANKAEFCFDIAESISWFAGHFPEQAVLPGVVQVHWATQLAKVMFIDVLTEEYRFKAANNIKFKTVILPKQRVVLKLEYNEAKTLVKFSYRMGEDLCSSGSLVFSAL